MFQVMGFKNNRLKQNLAIEPSKQVETINLLKQQVSSGKIKSVKRFNQPGIRYYDFYELETNMNITICIDETTITNNPTYDMDLNSLFKTSKYNKVNVRNAFCKKVLSVTGAVLVLSAFAAAGSIMLMDQFEKEGKFYEEDGKERYEEYQNSFRDEKITVPKTLEEEIETQYKIK